MGSAVPSLIAGLGDPWGWLTGLQLEAAGAGSSSSFVPILFLKLVSPELTDA